MTSHSSCSPDTAQHYNRTMGSKYGALTSPFLTWVCTSIPHNNCKRLNAISNLQRRKLSLGEFKSFAPGLRAPEWHGRNSKAVLSPALSRRDSSVIWENVSSIWFVPSGSQGQGSFAPTVWNFLSVWEGKALPMCSTISPCGTLTQPPSCFLRT